ncbi:MAG: peptidoglycan recognition family protein [Patescibacteria group bacterium]
MRSIDTIVVHHSVTDPNNKDIWAVSVGGHDYVPGLYIAGQEYKGNYHYLVYFDGEVKNPIPEERYTYHCGVFDVNLRSLAICFIGDYSFIQPSYAALVAARELIGNIKQRYPIANIYGHKELFATACPGSWYNLNTIMEATMKLDPAMIRRAYLSVLRREPDSGGMNYYLNLDITEAQLYYQLAESMEHTTMYDNAQKYLQGGGAQYQEITEKIYRKIN